MLAEIYLLKLEAAVRAAKEAADHRCDLAVCAGHLTSCQGLLTPLWCPPRRLADTATVPIDQCPAAYEQASFSPSPSGPLQRTPRIQNNSGSPQRPATGSVVG
jgi:hypothetical protein